MFQLESADDEQVNSDFAVSLMEGVGVELQELQGRDLMEFISIIRKLADSASNEARKNYLAEFPDNFGLQDNIS
ncbi:hypothetical protein [Paracoccus albus]|uniref:hypothetical protein n=1 Tax=Paracoccus albus TaxID=3017784 RepID=UPI0022F0FB1E|nr:hypothetical protein [Paracoccus albus]WBU62064.1 hypothetical protein PAF20_17460 [Paracoccus albus]